MYCTMILSYIYKIGIVIVNSCGDPAQCGKSVR